MNPIQMVNPAAEYRLMQAELDAAVLGVLASGRYILGPEGEALEKELAAYLGAAHAVGCNSGTDALHLPLVAAGIGPGDEVVIPAFTFFATGEAVSYTGAKPVFADIDAGTFNIDVGSLRKSITPKTKAVIAVHLFGQCAALDEISQVCKEKNLVLVEDVAQAIGADYDGRRAGSWGEFGGFSFYPTKNLGAAGDAGLMTTKSAEHDKLLRSLRHHGTKQTYHARPRGLEQPPRRDPGGDPAREAAPPRALHRGADKGRGRLSRAPRRQRPDAARRARPRPARVPPVHHPQPEARRDPRGAGEGKASRASVFYPVPLHQQPVYAGANAGLSLPNSESAARTVLSLPINPTLDDASLDRICAAVRAA